ncbi:hypothetical protein [Micromonospora sp. NPDC000442]|uniref:hypothetical protein n=1 Tax=Micromonospora sp. NPDC000442 TaxID=3364217 RepID=UPI0036BE52E4
MTARRGQLLAAVTSVSVALAVDASAPPVIVPGRPGEEAVERPAEPRVRALADRIRASQGPEFATSVASEQSVEIARMRDLLPS